MSRTPEYFKPICPWCQKEYHRGFGTSWALWIRCECKQLYAYQLGNILKAVPILRGPGKDGWKILTATLRIHVGLCEGCRGPECDGIPHLVTAAVVEAITNCFGRFKYDKEQAKQGVLVGEGPPDVAPIVQQIPGVLKVEVGEAVEEEVEAA
jgi:hypothetical protein